MKTYKNTVYTTITENYNKILKKILINIQTDQ